MKARLAPAEHQRVARQVKADDGVTPSWVRQLRGSPGIARCQPQIAAAATLLRVRISARDSLSNNSLNI